MAPQLKTVAAQVLEVARGLVNGDGDLAALAEQTGRTPAQLATTMLNDLQVELEAAQDNGASLVEVMRKEGNAVVLYDHTGKKKLQTFEFGKGKKHKDEKAARAAAHKREGQIKAFKKKGEAATDLAEHASPSQRSYVPMNVTSFADLHAAQETEEAAVEIRVLAKQLQQMVWNVVILSPELEDKAGRLQEILDEFLTLAEEQIGSIEDATAHVEAMAEFTETASFDALVEGDFAADILEVVGSAGAVIGEGRRRPVVVDLQIIKPGPGNAKDGHYYPQPMLERCAPVFTNAEIYVTDHKDNERSERTKVGRIRECPVRFREGAPVGRAIVYDPDQAEKIRNRADVGELNTLKCSIFAVGEARKGTIDGKEYKIVEAITAAPAVDFVSRAGAGGEAVGLVESDTGGKQMLKAEQVTTLLAETSLSEEALARLTAQEYADEDAVKAAILEEVAKAPKDKATEDPPKDKVTEVEPLAEAAVTTALKGSNLPQSFHALVQAGTYADDAALTEAIKEAETAVKALTGSGQVQEQGPSNTDTAAPKSRAELEERAIGDYNAVMDKYSLQRVPVPPAS